MKKSCVYCGSTANLTKDHIPPRCFFDTPPPPNLITVPSCRTCNERFSRDDEKARNLLTSLEFTVLHSAVRNELEGKRNRSMAAARANLKAMLDCMTLADRYSPGGVYLGTAPALNLDQPCMNRFFERLTRGLLYRENRIGFIKCRVEWKKAPCLSDVPNMPAQLQEFLRQPRVVRSFGQDHFSYAGWFCTGHAASYWRIRFYAGIEFQTWLRQI